MTFARNRLILCALSVGSRFENPRVVGSIPTPATTFFYGTARPTVALTER